MGKDDRMHGQEAKLKEQIVEEYRDDLIKLLKHLPYFESKGKGDSQQYYEGEGEHTVIPVPVYDSTLLAFVKEARATKFMNRNYPYAYRKWRMPNAEAERNAMGSANLMDIDLFRGILSKYVLEGQRKAVMWTAAVEERIFVTALTRLKTLIIDYKGASVPTRMPEDKL